MLSVHRKSSGSAARFSGTGAAALAGGAVAEEGSPSVRGGAASRSPSAVGEPLGAATGGRRGPRLAESGAGRKPRLSAEDLQKIERGLKHGPEGLRYETGLWTAWRVAHLIERLPCLAGLAFCGSWNGAVSVPPGRRWSGMRRRSEHGSRNVGQSGNCRMLGVCTTLKICEDGASATCACKSCCMELVADSALLWVLFEFSMCHSISAYCRQTD